MAAANPREGRGSDVGPCSERAGEVDGAPVARGPLAEQRQERDGAERRQLTGQAQYQRLAGGASIRVRR